MHEQKLSPSYERKRQQLGKVLPLSSPYMVILDASEACNFRCNYCFRASLDENNKNYAAKGELMTWETFVRSVDLLNEFPEKIKKISLSNHGEPLCNRKLPDMVRYIKKNIPSCVVEIHTNASLLDEEYILDLADSNIDKVIVSLQGLTSRHYLMNCGVNLDYEDLVKNIGFFYTSKKDTTIYVKIGDVLLETGQEKLFYDTFLGISDQVYIESIVPLWKSMNFNQFASEENENINKFRKKIPYLSCCSLVFYTMLVAPNGTVYHCTQPETSFELGNVNTSSLLQCWNGHLRVDFLKKMLHEGRKEIADCADCYIAQNSIMSDEDIIDHFRDEILHRLESVCTHQAL